MQKGYAVYCSTNIDFGQMEIFFVFNVYCRLMFRQYIYRSSLVSVNIDLVFSNTLTAIHSCLDLRGTLLPVILPALCCLMYCQPTSVFSSPSPLLSGGLLILCT